MEKKNTSKPETKNTTKNAQDYHLNNYDNPGTPLVTTLLNGENLCTWVRLIKTDLRAKTKLGFIDGSIKKPSSESEVYHDWEKEDSMVATWLNNVIKPNLHNSISHASAVRDVWVDLEERFAHTSALQIHQLWRNLRLMQKQPKTSVIDYYTQFKSLVDKLSELQTPPECSYGAAKVLTQKEEEQQVHLFLGDFGSEQYSHIKETILNIDPLPSLRRVFNQMQREESHFAAGKERDSKVENPCVLLRCR